MEMATKIRFPFVIIKASRLRELKKRIEQNVRLENDLSEIKDEMALIKRMQSKLHQEAKDLKKMLNRKNNRPWQFTGK
jgi:exonuclease VII small subunit